MIFNKQKAQRSLQCAYLVGECNTRVSRGLAWVKTRPNSHWLAALYAKDAATHLFLTGETTHRDMMLALLDYVAPHVNELIAKADANRASNEHHLLTRDFIPALADAVILADLCGSSPLDGQLAAFINRQFAAVNPGVGIRAYVLAMLAFGSSHLRCYELAYDGVWDRSNKDNPKLLIPGLKKIFGAIDESSALPAWDSPYYWFSLTRPAVVDLVERFGDKFKASALFYKYSPFYALPARMIAHNGAFPCIGDDWSAWRSANYTQQMQRVQAMHGPRWSWPKQVEYSRRMRLGTTGVAEIRDLLVDESGTLPPSWPRFIACNARFGATLTKEWHADKTVYRWNKSYWSPVFGGGHQPDAERFPFTETVHADGRRERS